MDNMVCSRNVDLRVCSGDVADLAFCFLHVLLLVDVTVYGNVDPMRMFFFNSEIVCMHKWV